MKGVVSKETVVLRRWGSSIQKFGFINRVDNVNWPPYREANLYGGQFTLSTPLIKPNHFNLVMICEFSVSHFQYQTERFYLSKDVLS